MSMTPTRLELAREIAERNDECGYVKDELICTKPRGHDGGHRGQPITRYVPID